MRHSAAKGGDKQSLPGFRDGGTRPCRTRSGSGREVRSRWLPVSETVVPVPVGLDQVVERRIRSRWLPVSETVAPVPVGFGLGSSSLGGSRDRGRKDCGTGLVSNRLPDRLIYPAVGCPHSGSVVREGSAIVGLRCRGQR